MTTRTEKTQIRQYVIDRYADRNPRNVRINRNGAVLATMDNGMIPHRHETTYCGWDTDILDEIRAIESIEAEETEYRRDHA